MQNIIVSLQQTNYRIISKRNEKVFYKFVFEMQDYLSESDGFQDRPSDAVHFLVLNPPARPRKLLQRITENQRLRPNGNERLGSGHVQSAGQVAPTAAISPAASIQTECLEARSVSLSFFAGTNH